MNVAINGFGRIGRSVFRILNSKKKINLPHMLVNQSDWIQIVSKMGIKNEDRIIIYDNSDVISSCRCWFNFIYFGHNPNLVHVLNGGLNKWLKENKFAFSSLLLPFVMKLNCLLVYSDGKK